MRAQVALEFITTYGWAILIVTIMIGALAYYGVVNPKNLIQENCISSPSFNCVDHVLDTKDLSHLTLSVNLPEGVDILEVKADDITNNKETTCVFSPSSVNQGQRVSIDCDFSSIIDYSEGQIIKINYVLTYKKSGGVYEHTETISTVNKVQKA